MYSIAHIVEYFKMFSQIVAKLSNNPFRVRDSNKNNIIAASSQCVAYSCDCI